MALRPALAAAVVLMTSGTGFACDIVEDPLPSWEQVIDRSEAVFVGTVVAIVAAEPADGSRRAVFEVETVAKGDIGAEVNAVMDMNSCNRSFRVGDHVIFAGGAFLTDDPQQAYMAVDSGWDPTVLLDDPPTPEQSAQLNYVNKLAEEQSAKGAKK